MSRNILIGGFCVNQSPLDCLSEFNLDFVDINLFSSLYSLDDMANQIIQQLDHAGNNILFGYSTGGLVALRAGLLTSGIIKQIVLINSTPKFMQQDNWGGIKLEDFNRMFIKLNNLELADFMSYFVSFAAYPRKIRVKECHRFFSNTTKEALLNIMHILNNTDLRLELQRLKDKVVLINSASDIVIAKNLIPVRQIYLPDSTHLELNEKHLLKKVSQILCNKS